MRIVVLLVVLILCTATLSPARVIYVSATSPNDPGTGSYDDPFRRIQDAIDSAVSNDIILIAAGLYTGPGNYALDFSHALPAGQTRTITVRSSDPNDFDLVSNTIINPQQAGRGFYFHTNEDPNCLVEGLTIRNAAAPSSSGAAIYCANSSPTVRNCLIINNSAGWGGAGIYCLNSRSTIRNCLFAANSVAGTGGAIKSLSCPDLTVINCTIVGNFAPQYGAGIYCLYGKTSVKNSILWANHPDQLYALDANVNVSCCDVHNGWPGVGNIDCDPSFVSFDPAGAPELWDFHLRSSSGRWDPASRTWVVDSQHSCCIDAGDPNSSFAAEPWPNGRRINAGVYGGTSQASMSGNPADFDVSGAVDFADFADFASRWQINEICIEDLTGDGTVDEADLAVFTANWLWQQP